MLVDNQEGTYAAPPPGNFEPKLLLLFALHECLDHLRIVER
jgi:hypothetical protein